MIYYYFFSGFSVKKDVEYVYIDNDDNIDSVYSKIEPIASSHGMSAFKALSRQFNYKDKIKTGRFAIKPGEGTLKIFRHMKNGLQTPVSLTIPSVRTLDKLSAEISKKLMIDSTQLYKKLTDEAVCQKYGYDTATIACMFIPNTYDIYWNVSIDKFLDRMQKEIDGFYMRYAGRNGLTKQEAMKKASEMDVTKFADKAAKAVKEKDFSHATNEWLKVYNLKMKVSRLELLKASSRKIIDNINTVMTRLDKVLENDGTSNDNN